MATPPGSRSGLRRRLASPTAAQTGEPRAPSDRLISWDHYANNFGYMQGWNPTAAGIARPAIAAGAAALSDEGDTNGSGAEAGPAEGARLRRGSTSSVASTDDEYDIGVVYKMLGRPRPPSPIDEDGEGSIHSASASTADEQHQQNQQNTLDEDLPCCRICFDTDEDEESGTLFSPCKCAGTARFVHTNCLNSWRLASANADAFFRCDQCMHKYHLQRTKVAAVLSHKATLFGATFALFLLLVALAGFAANSIIQATEVQIQSTSLFEDIFVSDHIILGEGMREAVDFFAGQVESSRWGAAIVRPSDAEPVERSAPPPRSIDLEAELEKTRVGRFRKWYRRIRGRGGPPIEPKKVRAVGKDSPWIVKVVMHMFKGLSLVGMLSFFQIWATAFLTPFGRTFFRTQRRNGANEGMTQFVVVAFVVIGVIKAIVQVFYAVKWLSTKALRRAEERVLNVN